MTLSTGEFLTLLALLFSILVAVLGAVVAGARRDGQRGQQLGDLAAGLEDLKEMFTTSFRDVRGDIEALRQKVNEMDRHMAGQEERLKNVEAGGAKAPPPTPRRR